MRVRIREREREVELPSNNDQKINFRKNNEHLPVSYHMQRRTFDFLPSTADLERRANDLLGIIAKISMNKERRMSGRMILRSQMNMTIT